MDTYHVVGAGVCKRQQCLGNTVKSTGVGKGFTFYCKLWGHIRGASSPDRDPESFPCRIDTSTEEKWKLSRNDADQEVSEVGKLCSGQIEQCVPRDEREDGPIKELREIDQR